MPSDLDILTRLSAGRNMWSAPPDAAIAGLRLHSAGTNRIDPPRRQDLERGPGGIDRITCIVHGEAVFTHPGPQRLARAGDLLVLPAEQPHAYASTDARGWRAAWLQFRCAGGLAALGLSAGPHAAGPDARRAFAEVLARAAQPEPDGPRLAAALAALLAEIAERPRRPSDDAVAAALGELRADPARAWSIPALAARHGLSASALRQGLRRRTGLAAGRLLRAERLRLAALRLAAGAAVAEAAAAAGFADPFHFSRLFRRAYGVAPRDWRRRQPG